MHLSRTFKGTFFNTCAYFPKIKKWMRGLPTSLRKCAHHKYHKNVFLSLETNVIQNVIKYYYRNILTNHHVVRFYSIFHIQYYLSVLLHHWKYIHNICYSAFSKQFLNSSGKLLVLSFLPYDNSNLWLILSLFLCKCCVTQYKLKRLLWMDIDSLHSF